MIFTVLQRRHLLFVFVIWMLFSCKSQPGANSAPKAIVVGELLGYDRYPNTKSVRLSSLAYGVDLHQIEARIAEDGTFRMELFIESSKQYSVKPFGNLHIYVNPGDSIRLLIDLDKPSQTKFSGDSTRENEDLNRFYSGGYFSPHHVSMQQLTVMKPDTFMDFIENIKRENLGKLDRFDQEVDLSKELYSSLEALVYNDIYTGLFRYGLSHCSALSQPKDIELKLEDDYRYYKALMDSLNRNGHKLVHHSSLEAVLDLYLHYLLRYHLQVETFASNDRGMSKRLLVEIIDNVKEPVLKEQILYRYFLYLARQHEFEFIEEHEGVVTDHIPSESLRSLLEEEFLKLKEASLSMLPLEHYTMKDLQVDTLLQAAISNNLGKIQFIEFWALWCKPCLDDMINSKREVATMRSAGDISVIYISADSDIEACTRFLEQEEIGGEHLFLPGEKIHAIMSAFGNTALPFQILISKDGHIVAKGNHYRLSSNVTRSMINQLKEKM